MTDPFVRLSEPPPWCYHSPTCSACEVELGFGHDTDWEWSCPSCGTLWPTSTGDGDDGTLYPDWSGEGLTGPIIDPDDQDAVAARRQEIERRGGRP